jgi:hypothetical protein
VHRVSFLKSLYARVRFRVSTSPCVSRARECVVVGSVDVVMMMMTMSQVVVALTWSKFEK